MLRRQRKRTVIQGKGRGGTLRGAPPPSCDFFVYRIAGGITENDIVQHLTENDIFDSEVTLVSHLESKFQSFKVKVSANDVSKIMNADIYPAGARLRKCFTKRDV